MTLFKTVSCDDEDDYIFVDNVDSRHSLKLKEDYSSNKKVNLLEDCKANYIEHCVCIEFNYFVQDVLNSFRDNNDIETQFRKDLPRCSVFVNNHKIESADLVIDYVKFKYNRDVAYKIIMLTTQAFLGLPFQIIFNKIAFLEDYYLSDIGVGNTDKLPYRIKIDISDDCVEFKMYKELRIFRLVDGEDITKYKVFLKLEFELLNDDNILFNYKIAKV